MERHDDLLAPPATWRDELVRALAPSNPRPVPGLTLALTHGAKVTNSLIEQGVSFADVKADMAAGATCRHDRGGGKGRAKYLLSGSRFVIALSQQVRQDSGVRLAMIRSIEPSAAGRAERPTIPVTLSFDMASASADCDLEAAQQAFDALPPSHDDLRDRAAKALAGGSQPPPASSRLHAQVRRQYGTLLLLMDLLRQRNEIEGGAQASGIVVEPPPAATEDGEDLLWMQGDSTGEFPDEAAVRLTIAGRKRGWRLELVKVEGDLFCLEPPPESIETGTAVALAYEPAFALKRHVKALGDFLKEDVEGDWTALAQLLSAPASLPAADHVPTPAFYNEALNHDQRAAVAGALAAPHAFFVQGPPGTGKTTVIAEIVRQLVARGERVLLLAPMHVAVDEVLQRVGDKLGVFALRTSFSDAKVRENLQRFLPQNVTAEFVRRARRPETSRAAIWRETATRDAGAADAMRRVAAARSALAEAADDRERALQIRASAIGPHASERLLLGAEVADAQRAVPEAQTRAHMAEQRSREAAQAWEAAQGDRSLADRIGRLVGVGEQARLQRNLYETAAEAQAATAARTEITDRFDRARAAETSFAERAAATERANNAAVELAQQRVEHCQAELAESGAAARSAFGERDPTTLTDAALDAAAGQMALRAKRLESFIHLERRWFELTGIGSADVAGARRRMNELGQTLLQGANLVCCTTTGFGGSPLHRGDYDTLIVDEASRVIDSAFLIGAGHARRWILVGDEHQLPPYVEPEDEQHLHALAALHMAGRGAAPDLGSAIEHLGILWREDEELHQFRASSVRRAADRLQGTGLWQDTFGREFARAYAQLGDDGERSMLASMRDHLVRSLFERCVEDCSPRVRSRLSEQRRMIDPIARIVREPIYQGHYSSAPRAALEELGVTPLVGGTFTRPIVFLDTSDQPKVKEKLTGTGFVNELEARWIAQCCRIWDRELVARGRTEVTVSVLSFYAAQAAAIRRQLDYPRCRDFRVLRFEVIDSIDRIQGQESDLVLLSFCRTRRGGRIGPDYGRWLQDVRRLNVACTRARRGLVLVGHRQTLERLCGVPAAEAFYANLFDIVDGSDDVLVLKHLDVK